MNFLIVFHIRYSARDREILVQQTNQHTNEAKNLDRFRTNARGESKYVLMRHLLRCIYRKGSSSTHTNARLRLRIWVELTFKLPVAMRKIWCISGTQSMQITRHIRLTMKTIGVVVLFLPVVYAVKGFTYNDDVVCGYPFENFVIESISCAPSSYIHVWPEGGEPSNLYDSHDVCAFGNEMEIVGKVTVSQTLSRIYHANLQACFRTSEASWYSAKKCMLFKTTIDLRTYAVQEPVEEGEDGAIVESQPYYNYVEPGEFTFSARVVIPKKTFVFNAGKMALGKKYLM